jgi:predicted anti-sigma-YlaC factor YlaD
MLSCKELVANSSDLLDGQLNLRQRLAVQMHLAMCYRCRRFIKQMRLSQRVLRALPEAAIPELDELASRLGEQARSQR